MILRYFILNCLQINLDKCNNLHLEYIPKHDCRLLLYLPKTSNVMCTTIYFFKLTRANRQLHLSCSNNATAISRERMSKPASMSVVMYCDERSILSTLSTITLNSLLWFLIRFCFPRGGCKRSCAWFFTYYIMTYDIIVSPCVTFNVGSL